MYNPYKMPTETTTKQNNYLDAMISFWSTKSWKGRNYPIISFEGEKAICKLKSAYKELVKVELMAELFKQYPGLENLIEYDEGEEFSNIEDEFESAEYDLYVLIDRLEDKNG